MSSLEKNPMRNTRIEFHIIQSFPVTCLNRDDVGAPKTAIVGGSTRARVSSQCWKRQVRLGLHDLGLAIGTRTKHVGRLVADKCKEFGAADVAAEDCGKDFEQIFIKDKKNAISKKGTPEKLENVTENEDNDTLLFIGPQEVATIASAYRDAEFAVGKVIHGKDQKTRITELVKLIGKQANLMNPADIALFGRMVAKVTDMNIEAAASFSHAISTHKISNEVEFFTALDDLQETTGSAHMGSLEFNSATYYRYISIDLGQLWENMGGANLKRTVEAFTKALYLAIPSARQTTQSGACPWEFAKVYVRKGQRLQVPFETAVKPLNGGFLQPSIEALTTFLTKKEKLSGSLFGKIAEFTFGENENYSIDALVSDLTSHIVEDVA